jgi:Fe-S oxidoreductase
MCPSFMVTREEEDTTRGRAHLLFEMMKGEEIRHGWRDEAVKKSLDLCLSCKGCKGDCPVNVDMATYKAEFLSHYFRGRLRPASAYSMGLVMYWARLASLAPGLVNFLTHTEPFEGLAKRLGGIAPQRTFPRFAPETFRSWFLRTRTAAPRAGAKRIMLWPDTFNNHFFPETARAALEVLESGGYEVVIPRRALCCGRPLYDYGMLPTARRFLSRIMRDLEGEIEAGTPIVGLEPSCVSVFRDELRNLFPGSATAQQLSRQVVLFSEFLQRNAESLPIPEMGLKALVHGHCHHKSLFQMEDEKSVLQRMGLDFEIADSGCCGMAGSFGFEKGERYEVAVEAGERVLLPKVREQPPTALIVADGFIAESRSPRAPTARRCTWPRSCAWRRSMPRPRRSSPCPRWAG